MRAFLILYTSDFESDDDRRPVTRGKSISSERRAFTLLSSVCWYWHQTLTGWSESPTSQWMRHQLKKLVESTYAQITHLHCTRVAMIWPISKDRSL